MTATISEDEVDTDFTHLLDWKHVPPCEATFDDGTSCENGAKFICSVSCCMGKILLCEECFFGFLEYCRQHEGTGYECSMCGVKFRLRRDHLKIVGRV